MQFTESYESITFLELPESGRFININLISLLEHEVIGDKTKAIAHFTGGDKVMLSGQDADFIIKFLRDA